MPSNPNNVHYDHGDRQFEVRVFVNGKWFESVYGTLQWCANFIATSIYYNFDYIKIVPVR